MNITKLISIFKWRVIVLHLLATCFFVMAAQIFFFIRYADAAIQTKRFTDIKNWPATESVGGLVVWSFYLSYAGWLMAVIISFIITKKLRLNILNAIVVLILGFFLIRNNWLPWKTLKWKFFDLGETLFPNIIFEAIVKILIPLIIGVLVFIFSYRYEKKKAA